MDLQLGKSVSVSELERLIYNFGKKVDVLNTINLVTSAPQFQNSMRVTSLGNV